MKKNNLVVWIKCRAISETENTKPCPGTQAEQISAIEVPEGLGYSGKLCRYRCVTCGRVFAIRI